MKKVVHKIVNLTQRLVSCGKAKGNCYISSRNKDITCKRCLKIMEKQK